MSYWIDETSKLYKSLGRDYKLHERRLMWGYIEGEEQKLKERRLRRRNLKYAYVFIANTRKMAMIDVDTNICYKLENKAPIPTWMIWKDYTLDRWCRGMDL
jgi:hypothetical protein